MLTGYHLTADRLRPVHGADLIAAETLWFDLLSPTREEETTLEAHLGLELPTKDEMQEIELSSRLYSEDGGNFMTALIASHTDDDDPVRLQSALFWSITGWLQSATPNLDHLPSFLNVPRKRIWDCVLAKPSCWGCSRQLWIGWRISLNALAVRLTRSHG